MTMTRPSTPRVASRRARSLVPSRAFVGRAVALSRRVVGRSFGRSVGRSDEKVTKKCTEGLERVTLERRTSRRGSRCGCDACGRG